MTDRQLLCLILAGILYLSVGILTFAWIGRAINFANAGYSDDARNLSIAGAMGTLLPFCVAIATKLGRQRLSIIQGATTFALLGSVIWLVLLVSF
jgi:hypothetical protein